MTAVALPGLGGWLGFFPTGGISAYNAHTNITLDAANDAVVQHFCAPKSGYIDRIEFRQNAGTLNGTITAGFMGFDASGDPDGTFTHSITVTPAASTWHVPGTFVDGSSNRKQVTAGDDLCFVIKLTAFTSGSGTIGCFGTPANIIGLTHGNWPVLAFSNAGGAWTAQGSIQHVSMSLYYADAASGGTVETTATPIDGMILPISTWSTVALSTSGTEIGGLLMQSVAPISVDGIWFVADIDGDITLRCYKGTTNTELLGKTFTATRRNNQNTGQAGTLLRFAAIDVDANTNYRWVLEGTTATATTLYGINANDTGDMAAMPGGATWQWTEHNGAHPPTIANFTDTDTRVPFIGLRVSKMDDGAGSVGGSPIILPRRRRVHRI